MCENQETLEKIKREADSVFIKMCRNTLSGLPTLGEDGKSTFDGDAIIVPYKKIQTGIANRYIPNYNPDLKIYVTIPGTSIIDKPIYSFTFACNAILHNVNLIPLGLRKYKYICSKEGDLTTFVKEINEICKEMKVERFILHQHQEFKEVSKRV